jgi:hypothetical protein
LGWDGAAEEDSGEESAAAAQCRGGNWGENRWGEEARSSFVARHGLRERRKGRGRSPSQRRQQAAPAGLAERRGSRSGHRPDVEERGAASAGNTGGGRKSSTTCGARRRGAQSSRAAHRTGRGRRRAVEEETERSSGLGKTKGTWL